MLRRAALVIAVSPAVADYTRRTAPAIATRVVAIPNGVDHASFARMTDRREPERPFILGVGRLVSQKGFDILVDAWIRSDTSADLLIVGDGPDRERLRAAAERAGRETRLHLPGFVDHAAVARLLHTATAVVIPSRFEGYPLVALEAMAAGAPIVASAIPEMPAEMRHGENALLVPPDDVELLANALRQIAVDPQRATELGRRAAEAAALLPDWPTITERVLTTYRAVLRGHPASPLSGA